MKILSTHKILFSVSIIFLSLISSLVWANLQNKDAPIDTPPGFVPDTFDLPNDYGELLKNTLEKLKDANQSKENLLDAIKSQEAEFKEINDSKSVLEDKISKIVGVIEQEQATAQTLTADIHTLNSQVVDKKSRLLDLISIEDGLISSIENLQAKIDSTNSEITTAQNNNDQLDLITRTPHTPGWHFTPSQGWLWSSPENYPMIYSEQLQGWVYYERGSQAPWLFYDYTSQSWQAWDYE